MQHSESAGGLATFRRKSSRQAWPLATPRRAENCTGALIWIDQVSKESLRGTQRSNRIIDTARHDAASSCKLSAWSASLMQRRSAGGRMIEARRLQRSFGDGLIAEEIEDLQETWMRHVNVVLQDDVIVSAVYQALAHRHPNSRSHGRPGFTAEVVLRLLILKHVRNWSYAVLEREVRANLVYRDFTRVGADKMPDAKTIGRWGVALGPAVIKQIHDRVVQIAQARKVVQGRKMRVDTTVVESNIHYPTDSSLLGDGVRVLTRMRKITELAGSVGAKLRDRSRSVQWRVLEIARAARGKAPSSRDKLKAAASVCSRRPAAWWDRPNASPRRSVMA